MWSNANSCCRLISSTLPLLLESALFTQCKLNSPPVCRAHMANSNQTQTRALTDWLWSKLWVDLAQLPTKEKKASAKKMRGVFMCWEVPFKTGTHTEAASHLWISLKTSTECVCVCVCTNVSGYCSGTAAPPVVILILLVTMLSVLLGS